MNQRLKDKALLLIGSSVFCLGFLITIIDGYYEYNYYHFIDIGRNDLMARLGFLSWSTGFIFYPLIIIIYILASLILSWTKSNLIEKQWVYLIGPAVLIGVLFYTHLIDFLVMEDMKYWRLGLTLMAITIFTYGARLRLKRNEKN